jgi:seryl-tRNA synthetase
MLDIKFIRENPDKVKKAIQDKRIDLNLDQLLDLDQQRRTLLTDLEGLQATKNQVSKEIPKLSDEDKKVKLLEMKEVDAKADEISAQLKTVQADYDAFMAIVPNIPSPETPVGKDDTENLPWSYWSPQLGHIDPKDGKIAEIPTKFEYEIKDHITLAENLDLVDTERGVKVAGFRGYFLKNEAVLLHYGILWHALKKLQQKGFTLMSTPTLIREVNLFGSGHFPFDKANQYQVVTDAMDKEKEPMYLAGTSEPSLIGYYADTILEEKDLPIKVSGISPCYRGEIGSYGKDTKGIYRVHEFMKVEQVLICKADLLESERWHETLREIAEEMLQDLKLPYRVLNVCTGDMGAGKYKMYDIETWMPSRGNFGETHSDSNLTDWQARRLNIRYRDSEGKVKHAYTLNNTAIASPRILIPILENYQQADGSIIVPEVLRPYVGVEVIKNDKNS